MRYIFCLFLTCAISASMTAQKTVRLDGVQSNNYGVAYTLPKTAIEVTVDFTKVTQTAGEFYMYADRYLNISNPIAENKTEYILDKLEAKTMGIPNKKESFLVEFRSNSAAAYITLTEDGLICAINDDYTFPKNVMPAKEVESKKTNVNVHQYFSEEMLRAGSTAKQAELIAKQIYKIRESRNDILTGDADNMPPDGDAYKLVMQQLDEQEVALTALFIGSEAKESMTKMIPVEINDKNIEDTVIARFSKKLGMVEPNDLSGEAIYLSLKAKNVKQPLVLSLKDTKDREKKFEKGIIYNIPGKATLQIEYRNKLHVDQDCDIVQFGEQDVLDQKQFGDRNSPLKVVFYPELGAIKETGIATPR